MNCLNGFLASKNMSMLLLAVMFVCQGSLVPAKGVEAQGPLHAFDRENLVAWCIVPFDKNQRNPQERAEMLQRLGLRRVAYDWREKHVPSFEEEILAYQQHGLEFFAFWGQHEKAFQLFERYKLHPQIWITVPSPAGGTQQEKVKTAAQRLWPLVQRTQRMGCKLGLYNHGRWGGQPENMVAVCQYLRQRAGTDHVGIVYNFHHAHDQIADFESAFELLKPYLFCLNLNGMNDKAQPKILPVGQGQHEARMIHIVIRSGYQGPVGIIDHRSELDTEESLKQNLGGLDRLLRDRGVRPRFKVHIIDRNPAWNSNCPSGQGILVDVDGDGDLDFTVGAGHWNQVDQRDFYWYEKLQGHECHNGLAGDIGGDGDIDFVAKNWAQDGPTGRAFILLENLTRENE